MKSKLNLKTLISIAVCVFLVLPITVFIMVGIFKGNPYGDEIRIDNFSNVFPNVSSDTRDATFASLYKIVYSNIGDNKIEQIPKSGALIRSESVEDKYNKERNIHVGTFIVDIDSIEQSYVGFVKWSDDSKNQDFDGSYVGFSCVGSEHKKYESFVCVDSSSDSPISKFPITGNLPIMIEYYSNNYTAYTKYYIGYDLSEDESSITLKIIDYTGGNYENALNKIRKLGFDPGEYEIKYSSVDDVE